MNLKRKKRRWTARSRKSIDAGLRFKGCDGVEVLLRGVTRDLGFGGMFLLSRKFNIPLFTEVTIFFPQTARTISKMKTVRAVVSHVADDGIGLRFIHLDASTCTTLQSLLLYQ
ncbi:MAG: PilZ domain-containing protein [Gammaproteobacteria bacterium]|nr:PilZ domain-containing protein [Gammaproteobacteria bacterium]MDH5594722.1 PilZ domain-containing protein [Gammaproteobacteria bacterium]MDH5613844.1 PilZ domain-containing protein [Gammaproteobacteria bacterium]